MYERFRCNVQAPRSPKGLSDPFTQDSERPASAILNYRSHRE